MGSHTLLYLLMVGRHCLAGLHIVHVWIFYICIETESSVAVEAVWVVNYCLWHHTENTLTAGTKQWRINHGEWATGIGRERIFCSRPEVSGVYTEQVSLFVLRYSNLYLFHFRCHQFVTMSVQRSAVFDEENRISLSLFSLKRVYYVKTALLGLFIEELGDKIWVKEINPD